MTIKKRYLYGSLLTALLIVGLVLFTKDAEAPEATIHSAPAETIPTKAPASPEAPAVPVEEPEPVREAPGEVIGIAITAENVFNAVNQERYAAGLPILTRNAQLDAAAEAKLQDMVEKGYYSHISPDGSTPADWMLRADYSPTFYGENLVGTHPTVQETVASWMASPTHKENILKGEFKETGIAVSETYVVQEFAAPAN